MIGCQKKYCMEELSRDFEIGVDVHQGSALSPHLFAVCIDVLSKI